MAARYRFPQLEFRTTALGLVFWVGPFFGGSHKKDCS